MFKVKFTWVSSFFETSLYFKYMFGYEKSVSQTLGLIEEEQNVL